jgi:hypothetical protein
VVKRAPFAHTLSTVGTLRANEAVTLDELASGFTMPLSVAGALMSLYFTHQTLNVFSQIGIFMLIGIVTKNGILIVEFANQRKEAGLSKIDAALEAAISRFRPILMTSPPSSASCPSSSRTALQVVRASPWASPSSAGSSSRACSLSLSSPPFTPSSPSTPQPCPSMIRRIIATNEPNFRLRRSISRFGRRISLTGR